MQMKRAFLWLVVCFVAVGFAPRGTKGKQHATKNTFKLAGRIMHMDIATGKILGPMESPEPWLALGRNGDIYVASLTGNIFRWYPGWVAGVRQEAPGRVK
jgi:hypothetical protein